VPLRSPDFAPPEPGFCPSGARTQPIIEPALNRPARAGAHASDASARGARTAVKAIKKQILIRIGQAHYDSWFARLDISVAGKTVRLQADAPFIAKWVSAHYSDTVEAAAQKVLGKDAKVDIVKGPLLRVIEAAE
jgi:hypothetical protein